MDLNISLKMNYFDDFFKQEVFILGYWVVYSVSS